MELSRCIQACVPLFTWLPLKLKFWFLPYRVIICVNNFICKHFKLQLITQITFWFHVLASLLQSWLELGNKQRATAATVMNDKSSRSHSVFTLVMTQTKVLLGVLIICSTCIVENCVMPRELAEYTWIRWIKASEFLTCLSVQPACFILCALITFCSLCSTYIYRSNINTPRLADLGAVSSSSGYLSSICLQNMGTTIFRFCYRCVRYKTWHCEIILKTEAK